MMTPPLQPGPTDVQFMVCSGAKKISTLRTLIYFGSVRVEDSCHLFMQLIEAWIL